MPPRLNLFTNRQRANSFGGAAENYDTHRPRYPGRLIDDVLAPDAHRVLEAGAGTGIASMQMIERGANVLAVEPDTRMAAVAQAKGIPVELATFEDWDPAGRRFDRVVFAASFHWVDPAVALPKIRGLLNDGGVHELDNPQATDWTTTDALASISWLLGTNVPVSTS